MPIRDFNCIYHFEKSLECSFSKHNAYQRHRFEMVYKLIGYTDNGTRYVNRIREYVNFL